MSNPRFVPGLALRVLEQITEEPERWNQAHYEGPGPCGTSRCVAGWAVALTYGSADGAPGFASIDTIAARLLGTTDARESLDWEWKYLFSVGVDPRPALRGLARRDHLLTCSVGSAWSDRMREVAR